MNHEERLSKSLFTRFLHIAWRIAGDIAHRVAERLGTAMPPPFDGLHAIGVDETSHRKGHTYLTVVVDHERHSVYGQINVYSVTTKSERYERSYWTRTAAGNGIGGRKAPVPYGS